ncbi:protein neprosin-like [Rutidosis leptorrhynchoides]|uniref:protein neprosin-like n=1 Tax=Rutidosis leptorrhynchoides TaxID=125765 RepID=UPI003A998EF5
MNLLKRLNKHPVKSIKSPDGDIIDCIDISHQPAFDHPSLKNHTIQMRPNYHPNSISDGNIQASSKMNTSKHESSSTSSDDHKGIDQLWHVNGKCPKGTIPIRRTKKEDVLRATSVKRFGKKSFATVAHPSVNNDATPHYQYAIAYVRGEFYGTKATMNIWRPMVQKSSELSLSQVWILGGSFDSDLNTIGAGWQVYPELYGDYNSRFFIYWTGDAYQKTGCYDLMCSGFIQTNNEIVIGGSVLSISEYQGHQKAITLLIWKDGKKGNWWMQYEDEYLGYWPSTLFSHLTKSASLIEWGGEVVNVALNGQHTTTQMGSGQFPENGFRKASYFRQIQIVDESNALRDAKDFGKIITESNCYNIQTGTGMDTGTDVKLWGSYFYYGGPGQNLNCP